LNEAIAAVELFIYSLVGIEIEIGKEQLIEMVVGFRKRSYLSSSKLKRRHKNA